MFLFNFFVQKKFQSSSSSNSGIYDERIVDILSALDLAQTALLGSPNIKRILVARLALTLADPKQVFHTEQLNKICRLFVSIEHLIQFNDIVRTLSSASYMYWHHEAILPIYLRHVIDINDAADCEKIQYLFESITDCYSDLLAENTKLCSEKLAKDTASILNEFIISKLCGHIETKLRLDVHTNLQLLPSEKFDPFDANASRQSMRIPLADLCRLLSLKPIPMLNANALGTERYLSVNDHVNTYLSQMFYNLTTISMHDWRTYGQMRFLAKQKFQLETVEDHLPTQTLEQVCLFSSNFLQIFVYILKLSFHLPSIIGSRCIGNNAKHPFIRIKLSIQFKQSDFH